MFELYILGAMIRGAMFAMENKTVASLDSEFIRSTARCALQWPVDVYDSVVGE